jgi:hypothetical protein
MVELVWLVMEESAFVGSVLANYRSYSAFVDGSESYPIDTTQ